MVDLERLFEAMEEEGDYFNGDPEEVARLTRKAHNIFTTKHTFKPGDLVQWKPYMRSLHRPKYGEPFVVVEVLDKPVLSSETSHGKPHFREPLDVVIGAFVDGYFACFHVDGRRLEPYRD